MTSRFQNPLAEKAASLGIICVRQKCRIFMFFSSALCSVWMQRTEFWSISNQPILAFPLFSKPKNFGPGQFWSSLGLMWSNLFQGNCGDHWKVELQLHDVSFIGLSNIYLKIYWVSKRYIWCFYNFLERYIWSFIEFQKGILKS